MNTLSKSIRMGLTLFLRHTGCDNFVAEKYPRKILRDIPA